MNSDNVVVSNCAKYKFAEQATAIVVDPNNVDKSLISFFDNDVKITLTTPFVDTCEYIGRVKGKCENRAKWFNESYQQWHCEKHCKKKQCIAVQTQVQIKTNIVVKPIPSAPHRRPKTKKEEDAFKQSQQKSFNFIAQLHAINMSIRNKTMDSRIMEQKFDAIKTQ